MEDNGLERPSFSSGNRALSENAGTESGTVQDETGTLPPDLAMVVNAWPALSEAGRKEILQVVGREASTEAVD